jgi:hypothetical protein
MHLDYDSDESEAYPSSEPTQTLMHWAELRGTLIAKHDEKPSERNLPCEEVIEEDQISPYVAGFRHSMSMDFDALEFQDEPSEV